MNRRFGLFFAVLSVLMFLIWSHVWFTLVAPFGPNAFWRYFLGAIFAGSFALQIYRVFRFRKGGVGPRLSLVTFFAFGLMIHLFCAAVLQDVLSMIPALSPYENQTRAGLLLLSFALNILGIVTALNGPKVRFETIPTGRLNKHLKIVQISDLHVGEVIGAPYVEKVVETVMSYQPDLIVLTGDIGDGDPRRFRKDIESFKKLKAPEGVFFVTGNHEYFWNAEAWIQSFCEVGVTALINQGVSLWQDQVYLAGVPDIVGGRFLPSHETNPALAIEQAKVEQLKILLAHQPKSCYAAEKAGFDVMLCGHTHAGQFFPINMLVRFFNPFHKGLDKLNKLFVYVSAGTGFWGPPMRLFVPAEISVLEIT